MTLGSYLDSRVTVIAVVLASTGAEAAGASLTGDGQIENGGAIALDAPGFGGIKQFSAIRACVGARRRSPCWHVPAQPCPLAARAKE